MVFRNLFAAFFIGLFSVVAADMAHAADQRIVDFKKKDVRFFDEQGSRLATMAVTPALRDAMIGVSVKIHKKTGMFGVRVEGATVYLSSRDINVEGGPGKPSSLLCGGTKKLDFRDGSSGSGPSCP